MKFTITRRFVFDAGHRVYKHEGKCAHLHGHRYEVDVTVCPKDKLDKLGRVVDFSILKQLVGAWIDQKLDHGMLLYVNDPIAEHWPQTGMFNMKHYLMEKNPTAENIAELIYLAATKLLENHPIMVVEVVVHETQNCSAVYRPD